jgi:hypothetical protein
MSWLDLAFCFYNHEHIYVLIYVPAPCLPVTNVIFARWLPFFGNSFGSFGSPTITRRSSSDAHMRMFNFAVSSEHILSSDATKGFYGYSISMLDHTLHLIPGVKLNVAAVPVSIELRVKDQLEARWTRDHNDAY